MSDENKEFPMAPSLYYNRVAKCRRCGRKLDITEHDYCPQCGQKVDWTRLPNDFENVCVTENNHYCAEDIKDWTPQMISAKIREIEYAIEELQKEYTDKRMCLLDDYNLLQTMISNKHVADALKGE